MSRHDPVVMIDVPETMRAIAQRRCHGFTEAAIRQSRIGGDFFEILIGSAYLQGVRDAAQIIRARREGEYEQER